MDYSTSIHFLEKRGHLKGLDGKAKEELVKTLNSNCFIYDPYRDIFYNPIFNKKYFPKSLESQGPNNLKIFLKKYNYEITGYAFQRAKMKLDELYNKSEFIYKLFSKLKWIGLILGTGIAILYDTYLGLSIGLYLIYLDVEFYNDTNNLLSFIQGNIYAASNWVENKPLYVLVNGCEF